MDALSINVDPRPLPAGWTAHHDHHRNMWYYVNLNTMPPQLHLVHPDDQGRESEFHPARPRRDTVPVPTISHRQHDNRRTDKTSPNPQYSTPFSVAVEALNTKEPTFAQKLYASSLPASSPQPTVSTDEGMKGLYGFSNSDAPWRTPSPQDRLSNIPTETLSSASVPIPSISLSISASPSSSPPFSSPLPEWIPPAVTPPPSRRPRGARTPSFPRVLVPSFSLSIEEDNPGDGDGDLAGNSFDRSSPQIRQTAPHDAGGIPGILTVSPTHTPSSLLPPPSSSPPIYAPEAMVVAPPSSPPVSNVPPMSQKQKRTRHNRSATFPNITIVNPTSSYSQSSSQLSNPKEIPMYTLVARPPEEVPISAPSHMSSFPPLPISPIPIKATKPKPILPPLIIPDSSGTGLPMGAAMPYISNNPVPTIGVPPTQPAVNNDQRQMLLEGGIGNFRQEKVPNSSNAPHEDHEVLKQVGLAVGKSAGKSALRLGAKLLLGNMGVPTNPLSSNNDVGDVISSGLTNMMASAATAAATAAIKTSLNPSNTIPSSTNLVTHHAAILAQTQGMQLQPPAQQIMPQQTGFNPSNAQMAALMAQMQMLQSQQQQSRRPPAQIPSSHNNNIFTAQDAPHHIPQQQHPQWQQHFANNVIGGATHALVSGAMPSFDLPSTMDSDNAASSFSDLASFDASIGMKQ